MLNGGPSPARRGAPAARREEGEYSTYSTDEQRGGRDPQPAGRREPFNTRLLGPYFLKLRQTFTSSLASSGDTLVAGMTCFPSAL